MKRIPTVAVDRDGVKVIINESQFDPAKDKLWSEKPEKAEPDSETERPAKTSKKAAKK